MSLGPQAKIGRYVIQGELGRGAMGIVYRALDPAIGRTVAVKTIRIGQFSDEREIRHVQDRMMREAQAAGILSHPHIITIYDIQHEGETAYIFMEFVDGDTLEKLLLEDKPIEPHTILRIVKQAAEALDYAHQRGIVHRDVKPANIMVGAGAVAKIADFGIARMQSHSLTQAGQILGTPNYMSPEQISGQPVDGRADQYSLAVMMFEVLTGQKPFAADTLPTLLFRVVHEAPPPALHLNPTLSPAIDSVLQRALAKDPNARFASCTEFMQTLEKACEVSPGWTTIARGAGAQKGSLNASTVAAAPQSPAPKHVPVSSAPAPASELPTAPYRPASQPPAQTPPSQVIPPQQPAPPQPQPPRQQPPSQVIPPQQAPQQPPQRLPQQAPQQPPGQPAQAAAPRPAPVRAEAKKLNYKAIAAVAVGAALLGAGVIGWKLTQSRQSVAQTQPPPAASEPPAAGTPAATPPSDSSPAAVSPALPATPAVPKPSPAGVAKPSGAAASAVALTTTPEGARVIIDDGSLPPCTSPCQIELPNGRHTATIALDTFKTEMRIFHVPDETRISVNLTKLKGFLEVVSTPPGATIIIDGAEHAQKTPALIPLVVGHHTVLVSLPGKPPFQQSFDMRGEATVSLRPNWAN